MRFWLLSGVGWAIAALALLGLTRIPGRNIDLYFSDRYVPVSKVSLVLAIMLLLVFPLLALTIRRLRG